MHKRTDTPLLYPTLQRWEAQRDRSPLWPEVQHKWLSLQSPKQTVFCLCRSLIRRGGKEPPRALFISVCTRLHREGFYEGSPRGNKEFDAPFRWCKSSQISKKPCKINLLHIDVTNEYSVKLFIMSNMLIYWWLVVFLNTVKAET